MLSEDVVRGLQANGIDISFKCVNAWTIENPVNGECMFPECEEDLDIDK